MRPLLLLALVGCASKPGVVGDTDPPDTDVVDSPVGTDDTEQVPDETDSEVVIDETDSEVVIDETDSDLGPDDTDSDVVPVETDTDTDHGTCVDPDLAANPYACVGPAPADDCTQAPTLQGWADAACTWQTANPTGCLPPRLPCTLDDGRTGTVIAAQADDVMSWPVYDDDGAHVGTFVRSDSGDEFCGRTADAWFGDPDWLLCLGIVPYWNPPTDCDPDACSSAP